MKSATNDNPASNSRPKSRIQTLSEPPGVELQSRSLALWLRRPPPPGRLPHLKTLDFGFVHPFFTQKNSYTMAETRGGFGRGRGAPRGRRGARRGAKRDEEKEW